MLQKSEDCVILKNVPEIQEYVNELLPYFKGKSRMKTGKVAKAFGIDRKTVTNWTDMPQFVKFFSEDALGVDRTQRDYSEADLVLINTIRILRNKGMDWSDIAVVLEKGERETELPPSALLVEGTAPIAQYGRIVELQATLEATEDQIDELREEIVRLREEAHQRERHLKAEVERLLLEASDREARLNREIGRIEVLLELARQKSENDGANPPR